MTHTSSSDAFDNCVPNTQSTLSCAIMQPTYMPWAGYFNLIASVDTFVFLDDVQFDRRSWQSRNRIFDGGKVAWLTCPVQKASRDTRICDIALAQEQNWQALHVKKIQLNYVNAPFFNDLKPVLDMLEASGSSSLNQSNQTLIKGLCDLLGIQTKMLNASDIDADGVRSQHLLSLCKAIGANKYVSPLGSKDYLVEDDVFTGSGVELAFQDYQRQSYLQKHSKEFVSHLSIIDVIANIGIERASSYVSGQTTCSL